MFVAGVDEAGRGPLVGSVVAAAVILDPENPIEGLNDSKKLSEKKREKLFAEIQEKEKLLQERLKHQPKKEVGFKATIINFKNKMIRYWHALKKKFSIDS